MHRETHERLQRTNSKGKSFAIGCVVFVVFLFVFGGVTAWFANSWYQDTVETPLNDTQEEYEISVVEGDTFQGLMQRLEEEGILKSALATQIYGRVENVNPAIKVGDYVVRNDYSLERLIETFETGSFKPGYIVTLREGERYDEYAVVLEEALATDTNFSVGEFTRIVEQPDVVSWSEEVATFLNTTKPAGKTLEGFLFPDTYEFAAEATAQDVIEKMILNLKTRLETAGIDYTQSGGRLNSFYDVLTMASIVEREAFNQEDRKLVADVFIKRIENNISLGSDPTVLYPYKRWTPQPTFDELQDPHEYNTRIQFGLTPTPINNPSLESIEATVNPTENPYFFFIADADSIVRYAETQFEHEQNIREYGLVE